jgi:hypothetical protein
MVSVLRTGSQPATLNLSLNDANQRPVGVSKEDATSFRVFAYCLREKKMFSIL